MNITEVRIKLMNNRRDKLQAFCSVTIDDDFVIRDLKVIESSSGPFVAMPSRKLADKCPKCSAKNHLRAGYCNECGAKLQPDRTSRDSKGRAKIHVDIAHPINGKCREELQRAVLDAYKAELEKAGSADYVPQKYDDEAVPFLDAEDAETPLLEAELEAPLNDVNYTPPGENKDNSFGDGIFT